jgi:hypothetical protein
MRYMLMIYGSEGAWGALTEDAVDTIGRTHRSLQDELLASGELIDHKELEIGGAQVVRTVAGVAHVADGPFSEGSEMLSGYYLVECVSLDRAAQIAACFGEAEFAPIEIRRLSGDSSWTMHDSQIANDELLGSAEDPG